MVNQIVILFLQVFNEEFTKNYLYDFLSNPIEVVVNCPWSYKDMFVTLLLGENKTAMITDGFHEVVQEFNLREGFIYSFSFRAQKIFRDDKMSLKLVISKI